MRRLKKQLQLLSILPLISLPLQTFGNIPLLNPQPDSAVLSYREMSLDDRYGNSFVNDVFKDNILLNLAYMRGEVSSGKDLNWAEITKPFEYQFTLNPTQTFAFHDSIEDKYQGSVVKTTNAHFNFAEGFKTDGYLFGDGVCHLASLIYWAAKDAQLEAEAPTNHNFMPIPDIPREYGVAIYDNPNSPGSNALQNLYIRNNKPVPITFKFEYQNDTVKVSVVTN